MGITADKILANKLVDLVVPEPLGGAHRDVTKMTSTLKTVLTNELKALKKISIDELLALRYKKLMAMGACE